MNAIDTIDVSGLPEEQVELLQKFVDFLRQQAKLKKETVEKQWQELSAYGSMMAEKQGFTEKDINRIVEEYRNEQSYAKSSS